MSAERCTRRPCDRAYRGEPHQPNEDGDVVHFTRVEQQRIDGAGPESDWLWRVGVAARNDGPWQLMVSVLDQVIWLPVDAGDDAQRLGAGFNRAVVWALRANLGVQVQ